MKVYQLAVFVDTTGGGGDWLTVVDDRENDLNETARMELATSYGHAETSFVESFDPARVTFYNPLTGEVPFAGQPMVGTSWLLGKLLGYVPNDITCGAGHVETWQEGDITWLRKNTSKLPEWKIEQFSSVKNVNEVKLAETIDWQHTIIWAWEDELAGRIRMRTFAPDWGIPEAESNGSGAMLLSAQIRKPLEIHHGRNSILYTRPGEKGLLALGGRCNLKTSEEE